jgi:hypothetical protein
MAGRALTRVALLALAALVLLLAARTRTLRDRVAELERERRSLAVGTYVPPFAAAGAAGETIRVAAGDRPAQLLLLFDPDCPFSAASVPAWNQLAERVGPAAVIALRREGSRDAGRGAAAAPGVPVAVLPDARHAALYRASLVPQTAIIDAAGRVVYARAGAVDGAAVDSVLAAWRRLTNVSE